MAKDLAGLHQAWGPKAGTPHATLTLMEFSREGPLIKFRLYASGVPKDATYTLISWPVTQREPSDNLTGVTLDANGQAICAGRPDTCGSADNPDDPISLTTMPVPGEPVRFGLISADRSTKVFVKSVPVPIRGDDHGCSLSATLLTPGAEAVLIEGAGFPPNSEVAMESASEGEHHNGSNKADSDGKVEATILPYKQDVARGVLNVKMKSAHCSPAVSVPWGRAR